ncbi:restriction endonuclease subunit S [Klebsiella variicola]|uniref:restriction endonuclease subunit S n=1 Tax=Klebsiella variicola TaxID=244366 RepID=UPI002659DACE|nr:restriction endonuclease subunit S [Klebsiella variicola]WKH02722.1 restriction endonuclease subunit S [Klebsiella variicola]
MGSNWPVVRIDDIKAERKNAITIGPFGSRMKSDCYTESGIAVIRGTNLGSTSHFINDFVYITEEKADELASCNVYKNDLVFPHRGSIGEVGIVEHEQRYVLSSSLMKLTCAADKACPKFIYYFFKSSTGRHELLKNASQVGTPGIGQPLSSLKSIELSLPPLRIQENIAKILSSLDEKIHINQQINQTLEQMAQALFKSWFVDFEPVKAKIAVLEAGGSQENATLAAMTAISGKDADSLAILEREHPGKYAELRATAELFPSAMQENESEEIPAGWFYTDLSCLALLNASSWSKKNAPESLKYVDLANTKWGIIHSTEEFLFSDAPSRARRILKPGDTIVGTVRPGNGSYAFVAEDGLTGSTGFAVLTPKHDYFSLFIYICATSKDNIERLAHLADGGAYPAVNADVVLSTPCIIPVDHNSSKNIIECFHHYVRELFAYNHSNLRQNKSLEQLRDTLLPKLLSGEITLPEAEELAKEADYV